MYSAKPHMNSKAMTVTAMFAAFICIVAPWTVPIGAVPISLGTFAVYLCAGTLGWKKSGIAVALYLMLGFVGMPVFTGFSGGFQKLAGPTGGYLAAYILLAVISAWPYDKLKKFWALPLGMVLGTAVLYAFGTAWYCIMSGSRLMPALMMCVVPFLPGDALKIVCASSLSLSLRPIANRMA